MKNLYFPALAATLAAVPAVAVAHACEGDADQCGFGQMMGGNWMGMGGIWPGSIFGFAIPLLGLIFWIVVIVAIIYLIKTLIGKKEWLGSDRSLEILKERYAKGEITKEEFEQRKKDLNVR